MSNATMEHPLLIEVLRRPLDSALRTSITVMHQPGQPALIVGVAGPPRAHNAIS